MWKRSVVGQMQPGPKLGHAVGGNGGSFKQRNLGNPREQIGVHLLLLLHCTATL